MKASVIMSMLVFGLWLSPLPAAQQANKVDLDAALTCLEGGATWSFLPHSEEHAEWIVIVVGSKIALASSETVNVGSLELPKTAETEFILKCANVPQLLKATKADWNSFVERLSVAVDKKRLDVTMFKVRKPASGQKVAAQAKVPLTSKDLVRTIGRD